MESLAMEVDDAGEEVVVVVEERKPSGGQKQAPSLPPKLLRKRVHAATAIQMQMGSQVKAGSMGSAAGPCKKCVWQGIVCVATDRGMRCTNCKVKYCGCSLVPAREACGGKGGLPGSQHAKVAAGSQTKGQVKKGSQAEGANPFSNVTSSTSLVVCYLMVGYIFNKGPAYHKLAKQIHTASATGKLFCM